MSERIESVSCNECGGTDVSYSPKSPFPPFCWDCKTWVDVILRTVKASADIDIDISDVIWKGDESPE